MSEQKTRKKVTNPKYTLTKNIKYNSRRFKAGEQLALSSEEYEIFSNAKVIEKLSDGQ